MEVCAESLVIVYASLDIMQTLFRWEFLMAILCTSFIGGLYDLSMENIYTLRGLRTELVEVPARNSVQ